MTAAAEMPKASQIRKRIDLCRTELAELKRILRFTVSVERANAARAERQQEQENPDAKKLATP